MTSRLVRAAMRLMPARRRDWAEALWAETGQAPIGWARLAWRAGGVRLIAREALLAQRAAWQAQADHHALTASLGTDGYAVILAFVPGLGLLLGLSAASAARPPGGPQLAGADADGP
jgi:hypothetical protein